MILSFFVQAFRSANLSRVCGDDPSVYEWVDGKESICPAYAGMILLYFAPPVLGTYLSRVCGDDPTLLRSCGDPR